MLEKLLVALLPWFKSEIKNTEEIKKEIGQILSKRNVPTVIILDDLDRLTAEQIKTVMQLVKVNADFPNTIFFMLYQKDIVENKLTDEGKQDGGLYMDKIVQMAIDIPYVRKENIRDALFNLLPKTYQTRIYNNYTFLELWSDHLALYFKNLRDVKRFLIMHEFYQSYFQDEHLVFNIDVLDFFIIDTLKMYEKELYTIIATNREQLVVMGFKRGDQDSLKVLQSVSGDKRDSYIDILEYLFDRSYSEERIYRLFQPSVYDRYFALRINVLPTLNVDTFLEVTECELIKYFDEWLSINEIKQLLDFILSMLGEISDQIIPVYLLVLLIYADDLDSTATGQMYSDWFFAVYVFQKLFEKLDEPNRIEFLFGNLEIFSDQKIGLSLLVYVYGSVIKNQWLDQENIDRFAASLLEKIQKTFDKDPIKFLYHSMVLNTLYRWRMLLDDPVQIAEKLENFIKSSKKNVLYLLHAFIESVYQTGGDFTGTKFYIKHKTIEQFVSIEIVKEAVSQLNLSELDDQEEKLIRLFNNNEDPLFQ